MPSNVRGIKCEAIITRGPNKGKQCTRNKRSGNYYCGQHTQLYGYTCKCTPGKLDIPYARFKCFSYNPDSGRWGIGPICTRCGMNFGPTIFRRTERIHPDDRIIYAAEILRRN